MIQIQEILNRLNNVRETYSGGYVACCPAHDSKSRSSLAIKEGDGGVILLHCFGGCSPADVCSSIGVEMSELFPSTPSDRKAHWLPGDLLPCLTAELNFTIICLSDMLNGQKMTKDDLKRLTIVRDRLRTAADLTGKGVKRGQYRKRVS